MRTCLIVTALSMTLSAGAQAQAILSAGALYGGPSQNRAVCYLYNSGTSSLTVSAPQITDPGGAAVGLTSNGCGTTLRPGRSCAITANVSSSFAYNCRFGVSPSKTNARGVFEMRNFSTHLANVELR
jgi:hypothetical protein